MSILFYNDRVLNEVMSSLLPFGRVSLRNALNANISELQKPLFVIDGRCLIACGILSIMIQNCRSYGHVCSPAYMKSQIDKIASAIKPSLRWKTFGRAFWKWLDEFDLEEAGRKELKLMNEFEELFLGIISFTQMENREKKIIQRSFKRFVNKSGFKDFDEFSAAVNALMTLERVFEGKPALYDAENMSEFERILGFLPETLILEEKHLNDVRLDRLDQSLVPVFFGGKDAKKVGVQWQPLSLLNLPTRLCFVLSQARRSIIQGAYKGTIFEDYLCNILTGRLIVAKDPENPLGGYTENAVGVKTVPGGQELLDKLDKSSEISVWHCALPWRYYLSKPTLPKRKMRWLRFYKYLKYAYRHPLEGKACNVVITSESYQSFKPFMKKERVHEWEEDILLLHDKDPKHCLIGQAKFTAKYNHSRYCKGLSHVEKIAEYLRANPSAKTDLSIPKDFPVVPVLFTSFTGSTHKKDKKVLKTTIFPVLQGKFLDIVSSFLARSTGLVRARAQNAIIKLRRDG